MPDKVLWVVNYNRLNDFIAQAVAVGATGVAIRTDTDIEAAITKFHSKSIIAWRWPSAMHDPAMKEAKKVQELYRAGLDGYIIDPEGQPGKPWNWDQSGLDQLADEFCNAIKSAGATKPFGVTSHYRAKAVFPKLPWAKFFSHATVLLPQAHWRSSGGMIGHGIPADNYDKSVDFWAKAGEGRILSFQWR